MEDHLAPIGPARVARPLQFLHPDTPDGTLWQPRLFVEAIESSDGNGDVTWRSPKLDEVNDWLRRAADAVKALEVLDASQPMTPPKTSPTHAIARCQGMSGKA